MKSAIPYDFQTIEAKWRQKWLDDELYKVPEKLDPTNKLYVLPQLPYPSGSGLHVGHAEGYTACDIYARAKRMMGHDVLQVIGWDAFGLPAENYAIKNNVHPKIITNQAIDNFRDQIQRMGNAIDWEREVGSHQPAYYKWTQWFFQLMYNQGLAYRDTQKVNWCDSCKTVLANEQVIEGQCERCDSLVEHRQMEQWYFRITEYADRLYQDLDKVDWPKETVINQRNWIGKSEGINITYQVADSDQTLTCFTTTPVNWGATFIVLAPEHPAIPIITSTEQATEVQEYVSKAMQKTDLDRKVGEKNKTGSFTGAYAINHVTGEKLPIWVADFVLGSVGTGAVQGCPGHDKRDFEFASKFGIPIPRVVVGEDGDMSEIDDISKVIEKGTKGTMINSDFLNGMDFKKAMQKTMDYFEEKGWGKRVTTFRLRDWSISRQRFWGSPIPMLRNDALQPSKKLLDQPDHVVQLHAWGSSPDQHFHPWLAQQLAELEIDLVTPELPEAMTPDFQQWLRTAQTSVPNNGENTVVIGRSLSTWTTLKLAETQKLRKLVLVAPTVPTTEWLTGIQQIIADQQIAKRVHDFVANNPIDFDKVMQNVSEIVCMLSTDDPYIDLESTSAYISEHLPTARILRVRQAGHFDADHGFAQFPKLLTEILAPVRPDIKPADFSDLPVTLPDDVDFKPTGQSPLTYSPSFQSGVEQKYGKGWQREVDTLDTFMCSSWYYYRYIDPHNDRAFASPEALKRWMPVDFYIGGPEHTNGHLLYSRFFTKVLYDAGYIDFDEPFIVHRHQGLILGEDSRKMSKRWGNVINPTEVMDRHGADTLRMYEMFMGHLAATKAWNREGESGVYRFLQRVWRLQDQIVDRPASADELQILHQTIDFATQGIDQLGFNTTIAKYMELVNFFYKQSDIAQSVWLQFLILLAPYAPYISEELWQKAGQSYSVHQQVWPQADPQYLQSHQVTIVIQINGKVRANIEVTPEQAQDREYMQKSALSDPTVLKWLDDQTPKKVIVVPGKLVSIVV